MRSRWTSHQRTSDVERHIQPGYELKGIHMLRIGAAPKQSLEEPPSNKLSPSKRNYQYRQLKYDPIDDFSQASAKPLKPKSVVSLWSKRSCTMVLNAAETSSEASTAGEPLSGTVSQNGQIWFFFLFAEI